MNFRETAEYAFDQERIAEADATVRHPEGFNEVEYIDDDELGLEHEPVAEPYHCPDCDVYDWNVANGQRHICVEYHDRPCVVCGAPTTFVTIAAPGYGQGYSCKNGHYDGSQGELTPEDVR